MLEETLQICRQMWSDNDGPYHGKHYQLAETICEPQPIRRPPILIGGDGEKKTLRLVAQYADIWNSMTTDVDELKHKIDVLNRHCDTVGRDPGEIRKTCGGLVVVDPFEDVDGYLKTVQRYAELGIEMINVGPLPGNPDPVGFIRRFGDRTRAQARSDRLKRRNRLRFNNYHHGGRTRTLIRAVLVSAIKDSRGDDDSDQQRADDYSGNRQTTATLTGLLDLVKREKAEDQTRDGPHDAKQPER